MRILTAALYALFLGAGGAAQAQVVVGEPWVRASVPGQMGTGAFMTLTAATDAKLVGARTPVAGFAEVHEVVHQNDVMRMRAVDVVPLPAGRAVQLKPGSYHLMLFDLKRPLSAGEVVPLTLDVEQGGVRREVEVQAAVRAIAAPAAPAHNR